MDTTSPNQCCPHCDKKYTRKTSYTRHVILCEVLHQTKREKKCAEEETTDIPTTRQLYNIIQELAIKYQNMEQQMNEMQKWVEKRKKKLNVIHWLNSNYEESIPIQQWIQSIQVTEEHIEILIEHNMAQIYNAILINKIQQEKPQCPLFCLTQKNNLFYCFTPTEKWIQFSTDEFIIMLKRIHPKIVKALCEWHDKNSHKINSSDKMQILYNKTMIKLMSVNFTQESQILSKIKNDLYQYLKTDFKNIIEYEYEF